MTCAVKLQALSSAPTATPFATRRVFEEKREAVMAIEAAVMPLMPTAKALAA
jgi:hypothetical protein